MLLFHLFFTNSDGAFIDSPILGNDIIGNSASSIIKEGFKSTEKREIHSSTTTQENPMMERVNNQTYTSAPLKQSCNKYDPYGNHRYDDAELDHMEELQRESAQLTVSIKNAKLDDVQKVESEMAQIMGLLSQFTSLIAEQQEEIADIHDKTIKTKDNVKSGNEHLIEATERRKSNKHYFAKFIVVMAFILLFLNWITP